FLNQQWAVAELLAEFLGSLLLALADLATIDDDVVLSTVDLNGAEREFVEAHARTPGVLTSAALLRGHTGERGSALLDIFAAAMRAAHLSFLVVDERKTLLEEFLALLAEELVVGHRGPPQCPGKILDLRVHGFNASGRPKHWLSIPGGICQRS